MKICPKCGTGTRDNVWLCPECNHNYADPNQADTRLPAASTAALVHATGRRPSGQAPMTVGSFCLAASILLMLFALGQGTDLYGGSIARQWLLQLGAGCFFSLFLVFWSVGYIVHAISFLPSKE